MSEKITLTKRWYLVEDGSRVVSEGEPEGRWLHWRAGDEVELTEALRLGAVRRKETVHVAPKKRAAPHNKQADTPHDKGS